MYEERDRDETQEPCSKSGVRKEREEKRSGVTERCQDTELENKVSNFSPALLFFSLHLSLIQFFPFSSGLKSDIHHSRVPQTIYLECRRHENQ